MTYTVKPIEPNIRKVYNPSPGEHDVLRHVYDRFRSMADSREKEKVKWDKWRKQWECYRPEKAADDWMSDLYIPLTTSAVEAMMAEVVNQELIPYVVERGAEDAPKAMVVNNMLQYTWDTAKSDVATFEIVKDAFICGTGIGQEYYWKQDRQVRTADGKEKTVTEYDDCYLEPVTLEDFYPDEKGRSFFGPHALQDCVRRYIMDYDSFRQFFDGAIWNKMGNASLVKPGAGDTSYYEFFKPPESFDKSNDVEVLWYWNKLEDRLAIVANDILVVDKPNPYMHKQLPFARAVDVKRTHQFYGRGEAELLESLQEETNTLRRMIIDRNHLDLDKPVFVSDTLTLDDEDAIAAPHKIYPVSDPSNIKFPEYSDIAGSVFKSLEMMNDDKIRVTGLDERQQSVSTAGTATEAAILKEATLKRLNMKIWQIKNDFLVDVGRLRVANIMQFYAQPKLEKIVGSKRTDQYRQTVAKAAQDGSLVSQNGENYQAKFRNIRLKDKAIQTLPNGMVKEQPAKGFTFFEAKPQYFLPANGGFDIRYKATSSIPVSKPLMQQKVLELYDRLVSNPTVDPWKLAEMVLKSQEFDPDEYKMQQQQGGVQDESVGLQEMVDLAGQENGEMMNGVQIGPTAYASPAHTEIHISFMKSPDFQEGVPANSPILQNFANHVTGELTAQQARGGGGLEGITGGGPSGPQRAEGQPMPMQPMAGKEVIPGKNQGGGEMPSGMRGAETGIAVGRKV